MKRSEEDILYEDYNKLEEEGIQSSKALDKSLITLSAGALLLSTTFLTQLLGTNIPVNTGVLYISWGLFSGTIVSTLMGYMFSQYYHWYASGVHWQFIAGEIEEDKESKDYKSCIIFSKLITVFNIVPLVLFSLAVISLLIFCGLNIEEIKTNPSLTTIDKTES